MKKSISGSICMIIALCFLSILAGCVRQGEKEITTDEEKRRQLQNKMISFFSAHQDDMLKFALQIKGLDDTDPAYHYLYAVKENALIQFDDVHIQAQGKVTEHPILSDAAFFKETQAYEWVAWGASLFECRGCFFTGEVYDESGVLYAELYLFYTEDKPITDEYMIVEQLAENWYFYCEYRQ